MTEDILGYLLDTLESKEQEAIERRMASDPAFCEQVEEMRKLMLPLAEDDCIQAPPDLCGRTIRKIRQSSLSGSQWDWAESRSRMRPVDTLVAACVLGVAAALVLPAISTLSEDQVRIACANQLRQLGVALAMYAEEENDFLPYVSASGPTNNAGIFALLLHSRGLISDERTLVCPATSDVMVLLPEMERYLREMNDPVRMRRLRKAMSGSYGYVLGYRQNGAHHGLSGSSGSGPIASDRPPRALEVQYQNSPNHRGRGQNVLFTDGHVLWLARPTYAEDDLFRNSSKRVGAGIGEKDCVIGVSESIPYPRFE